MIADISAAASQIDVPVHVIAGSDDNVEPESSLRAAFGKVHIAPLEAPAKRQRDPLRSDRVSLQASSASSS